MDSAPILLPSPQKSPFRTAYSHEIHDISSEEEQYSYNPSPDEAVFDDSQDDSQDASSPHTSDDDLSTIPPEPDSRAPSTIYTPHKRRSPFRHPSSVRNIQLETTPPHLISPARREYHLQSPSRNSTPRSHFSSQSRPQSARSSPAKKQKSKKEHPLVLLHLTLLPLSLPYSQSLLETVLPPKKLADCKLLKEKLSASVIQERGVLIPHPRDDYDLLEERLLEALELEQGALTRDGHFLVPEDRSSRAGSRSLARTRYDSEDILEEDEEAGDVDDDTCTEVADAALCEDCGKHIRTINSDRRWDIRIYAANGLMREGAWSAAWREMERVDVEIKPFIPDELKRELEDRWEEMELLLSAPRKLSEESTPALADQIIHQSIESDESMLIATTPASVPADQDQMPEEARLRLSTERLKEIYGEQADAKIESMKEEIDQWAGVRASSTRPMPVDEIPLSTLLAKYIKTQLQDRRNIAILCLSTVVLFMATQMVSRTTPRAILADIQPTRAELAVPAVSDTSTESMITSTVAQLPTTTNPLSVLHTSSSFMEALAKEIPTTMPAVAASDGLDSIIQEIAKPVENDIAEDALKEQEMVLPASAMAIPEEVMSDEAK